MRKLLLILVSTLTGVLAAALLFALAEAVVRLRGGWQVSAKMPRFDEALSKNPTSHLATRLPVHLPKPSRTGEEPSPTLAPYPLNSVFEEGYSLRDPWVGLLPGRSGKGKQVRPDGSLEYEVFYTVDSAHWRRVTPGQENGARTKPLLFLGCSFTYGEGLTDDETLPAQAARLQTDYRVYNYGYHAWGPNNVLRWVSDPRFATDIPRVSGGKAVYLYIDHHMSRLVGSLDLYRKFKDWANLLPYFFLDGNGKLQTEGMFGTRPVRHWIFSHLADSALLNAYDFQLPTRIGREEARLFGAVMAEIQRKLAERFPGMQLVVAFYPGSDGIPLLAPELDARGISWLDYQALDLRKYVDGPFQQRDGHASAGTDRFLARQILTDLGIIGSERSEAR